MSTQLQRILSICDRHFFAKSFVLSDTLKQLKLGPVGELLRNNIYHEWHLASIIRTENVFPYCIGSSFTGNLVTDLKEPFLHSKFLTNGQLPFGVATQANELSTSDTNNTEIENPNYQTVLKIYMFLDPQRSTQYFDEWQQVRKSWWRKISAYPGRFTVAGDQTEEESSEVQILAEFSWGKRTVETLSLKTSEPFGTLNAESKQVFEAKDGRRKVMPHVLVSKVHLESLVLTYLCDAYDEYAVSDMSREVLRFHRKLAPYKASFSVSATATSASDELLELAQFLAKQLRTAGISTLLLPDAAKRSLESQFVRNDELGIPYTVVMNDSTLKNGIIGLRNRDTTLKEQVHITDLKKYMVKIFEAY